MKLLLTILMKRRDFLQNVPAALMATPLATPFALESSQGLERSIPINHSVARWCLSQYELDELLPRLKDIGIHSIDLVGPQDYQTLKKHEMHCSMCEGAAISLTEGFNDPQYHDELVKRYTEAIPKVADAGFTNLICFSGNRRGMDDLVGLENCAIGLERILPLAEKYGVIIQMELFNAQDHPDYMCDSSLWGISLCRRLGTPHFKLLYDIYHMQIQEGDIIHQISEYHEYFGHYHTAGVPGRNEIGADQELYYPAIMRAIAKTGFNGYVAQEFIPTNKDPFVSMAEAIGICEGSRLPQ